MLHEYEEQKTILYYPTIKIRDGYWLRNAILYWDKIASIVPGTDYNETNSVEVEYLRDAKLYEPIYPIELENNRKLCILFCDEVKEKIRRRKRHPYSGRKKQGYWDDYTYQIHREKLDMGEENAIHINKMPYSILDYLLGEGLAKEDSNGPWINMKSLDAEMYMAILAKYLAKVHNNTEIGTDLTKKFHYPYVAATKEDRVGQYYLDIALEQILPIPNIDVPIQDVLDFKVKYEKELNYFRRRIDNMQRDIKRCSSEDEFRETILFFQREINDELADIENLMCNRWKKILRRSIRSLVPIGITAVIDAAALLGEISTSTALQLNMAVSAGAAIFSAWTPRVSDERQLNESNSYLFYARNSGLINRRGV